MLLLNTLPRLKQLKQWKAYKDLILTEEQFPFNDAVTNRKVFSHSYKPSPTADCQIVVRILILTSKYFK